MIVITIGILTIVSAIVVFSAVLYRLWTDPNPDE